MKTYKLTIKENESMIMFTDGHPLTVFITKHSPHKTLEFEIQQYISDYCIKCLLNGILFIWWCDSYKITDIDGNEI